MPFRALLAAEAFWRPSNQMGVLNTDLAKQLELPAMGARLWRLRPGQASTRHRHAAQHELYVVLDGTGRMRVDGEVLTLPPLSAVGVTARTVRQVNKRLVRLGIVGIGFALAGYYFYREFMP